MTITENYEKHKAINSSLLFVKIGDFLECFYDDAILVSSFFNMQLLKRGIDKNIPMVGFPYHSFADYKSRLEAEHFCVTVLDKLI